MRYLLLIHSEESGYADKTEEEMGELLGAFAQLNADLEAAGAFRGGERLRPTETATTVRVRGDETLTTDGPFAETKEQLGGFYIIEAENLDEALRWAARIPTASYGSVEVRPIWEME